MERVREYVIESLRGGQMNAKELIREAVASEDSNSVVVNPLYVDMAALEIGGSLPEVVAQLSSATYPEVRLLECAMAIENGADQVEVAVTIGELEECGIEPLVAELSMISQEIADEASLGLAVEVDIEDLGYIEDLIDIACQSGASSIKILGDDTVVNVATEIAITLIEQAETKLTLKSTFSWELLWDKAQEVGVELIEVAYIVDCDIDDDQEIEEDENQEESTDIEQDWE